MPLYFIKALFGFGSSPSSSSSSPSLPSSLDGSISAPDGGWGWVVVAASFLVNMIADGVTFSFGLLFIELQEEFQESKAATAGVVSLFHAVPLLSGPIASALTDRYGCRRMTILGSLLATIGFLLSSQCRSLEALYVTFGLISGFGLSLCYVAAIVIVAFYFDAKRSFATGIAVCGSGVGTFVFAPLTQYLISEFGGWRGATIVLAGFILNICVCGALFRDLEWALKDPKKTSIFHCCCQWSFCNPSLILFFFSNFILYAWYDVMYVYLVDYAEQQIHENSDQDYSFLISMIGITNTIGEVIVGWAGDREWINRNLLYAMCMVACGVSTALVPFLYQYTHLAAMAGIYGFGISVNYSLTSVILVDLVSLEQFTNAYGLLLLAQGVSNLVGPPFAGFLYDITQEWFLTFGLAGLFITISGFLLLILPCFQRANRLRNSRYPRSNTETTGECPEEEEEIPV